MGFNKEKIRQIQWLMLWAAILILAVIYSNAVLTAIIFVFGILTPFIEGGVIAFILNLPMKFVENKILKNWKGKAAEKLKRPVSMVVSIAFVILVINLVIITVVPQVTMTATEVARKVPGFVDDVVTELEKLSANYPELEAQIGKLDDLQINYNTIVNTVIGFLKNGMSNMLTSTVSVAGSIIGGAVNLLISLIFALYILGQKEKLADQGKRIMSAYLPQKAEVKILKVLSLMHRTFSNFITGQCLEAVILGSMFIIAMTIFRMPYALLVGVLIAFTALIPIVGAFIGCVVGAFLILIENPLMALGFVILFLVIQQIEGNLIYPRVVGNSVGLPAIWVLMAVSVGGSLFGVAGMLFFIPLLSTCYALLRESVNEKNAKKQVNISLNEAKAAAEKKDATAEKNDTTAAGKEADKKVMGKHRK